MDGLLTNRSSTPESPMTNSFYHASSTIDDLTAALANFSRVPSPEPTTALKCCCDNEHCGNLKTWLSLKSRLNSRLILSAEVGQALLQRHEAYVRQSERDLRDNAQVYATNREDEESMKRAQTTNEHLNRELDEIMKEKMQLEKPTPKSLNQALVNNEVTEVSNKTILQELQEAKSTISRLSAHHARSLGWDTRLSAAMKERDDMQQERDGETHRARLAESRFAALKEKTGKLQVEVRRLLASLEEKRHSRLEFSESVIQDARTRLESIRSSHFGRIAKVEQDEVTTVIEALVEDNESLKRDNAELQHLLSESREDVNALQQEVDEQRANPPPQRSPVISPYSRHGHSGSIASISLKDYMLSPKGRSESMHRRRQGSQQMNTGISIQEPMTPLTMGAGRSPLSPTGSLAPFDNRWLQSGQRSPHSQSSHVSFEMDDDPDNQLCDPPEAEKPKTHRPLLLLTRSRGVQTESIPNLGLATPSPLPSYMSSISPQDPRSESSSFSETMGATNLSSILERISSLMNRLSQADPLTLTNRLKRQHLQGADVGHLSRSTINNVLSEAGNLRAHYRTLLEDDKTVTMCTRKDLRNLFKLVKDLFNEMGNIRSTLNDIILDPASASRISERALNPGKTDNITGGDGALQGTSGWIEGFSKLFVSSARVDQGSNSRSSVTRAESLGGRPRPSRFVPKLGPALAASATTVNVEFTGVGGVGRATTSTFTPGDTIPTMNSMPVVFSTSQSVSAGLMDIFAGAPKSDADPWVILPTAPRTLHKSQSFMRPSSLSTSTIGRNTMRRSQNRLSRQVDAVIDVDRPQQIDEEPDFVPPLLERTLLRRGLSDTSIHSTFTNHAEDTLTSSNAPSSPRTPLKTVGPSNRVLTWSERTSVFSVLTSTVRNLHKTAVGMVPQGVSETPSKAPLKHLEQLQPAESGGLALPTDEDFTLTGTRSGGGDQTPPGISSSRAIPIVIPETPPRRRAPLSTSRTSVTNREAGPKASIPNLPSRIAVINTDLTVDPFIASSLRDESYLHRMAHSRTTHKEDPRNREFF